MMVRFAVITLCCIFLVTAAGCNIDLSEQGQKDRALAEKVNQKLETGKAKWGEYVTSIERDKNNPGRYTFKFEKTDMTAQEVFDKTVEMLFLLQAQNDVVQTGRTGLALDGYMGKEQVSHGVYASGTALDPFKVTLMGRYEGQPYNEDYKIRRAFGSDPTANK